jgi:hypothetical protein
MIDAAPPHSTPSWQFLEALPGLTRIADELQLVLQPAMTPGRDEDRGFARSAWMLTKALRFLLEAAQSDDPSAFGDALAEAVTDALAAAGHVRSLHAAAATVEELAAAGEISRSTGLTSASARPLAPQSVSSGPAPGRDWPPMRSSWTWTPSAERAGT